MCYHHHHHHHHHHLHHHNHNHSRHHKMPLKSCAGNLGLREDSPRSQIYCPVQVMQYLVKSSSGCARALHINRLQWAKTGTFNLHVNGSWLSSCLKASEQLPTTYPQVLVSRDTPCWPVINSPLDTLPQRSSLKIYCWSSGQALRAWIEGNSLLWPPRCGLALTASQTLSGKWFPQDDAESPCLRGMLLAVREPHADSAWGTENVRVMTYHGHRGYMNKHCWCCITVWYCNVYFFFRQL